MSGEPHPYDGPPKCPHGVVREHCANCSVGDWYESQRKEAEALETQLQAAKKAGAPAKEIRRLEYALELARYVGD